MHPKVNTDRAVERESTITRSDREVADLIELVFNINRLTLPIFLNEPRQKLPNTRSVQLNRKIFWDLVGSGPQVDLVGLQERVAQRFHEVS